MDRIEDLSDEELLTVTARQPEAFGVFYRRHERAMLVFFMRRTRSAELAADLTAEVFAAALGAARRFRPSAKPAVAWLYGIANNKLSSSCSRGRVEERARRRLGSEPLVLTDEALERVEALADAARGSAALNEMLDALPAKQRQAVLSHVIEDRAYEEIAGELRCSEAVVRQRVSRGLRALRMKLSEESP